VLSRKCARTDPEWIVDFDPNEVRSMEVAINLVGGPVRCSGFVHLCEDECGRNDSELVAFCIAKYLTSILDTSVFALNHAM
jgi:hypothetical protein